MTIAKLAVSLVVNTSSFAKGMTSSVGMLKKFGAGVLGATTKALKFGLAIGVGVVAGLTALTVKAFSTLDAIGKLSNKVGASVGDLMGLQRAAELTGSSATTLNKAFERLTRRVGLYSRGSGAAAAALKSLGFSQKELLNKTTIEQFKEIADRLRELPTLAERSAATFEIFGLGAQELMPILNSGSEGIENFINQNKKLFGSFSREELAGVESMNDTFADVTRTLTAVGQSIAVIVAPAIDGLLKRLLSFVTLNGDIKSSTETAFETIVKGVGKAIDVYNDLHIGILKVGLAMRQVIEIGLLGTDIFVRFFRLTGTLSVGAATIILTSTEAAMKSLRTDISLLDKEISDLGKLDPKQDVFNWLEDYKAKLDEAANDTKDFNNMKPELPDISSSGIADSVSSKVARSAPGAFGFFARGSSGASSAIAKSERANSDKLLGRIIDTSQKQLDVLRNILRSTKQDTSIMNVIA